jgi:phage/plasmid-like protein (TIGR03299 family)
MSHDLTVRNDGTVEMAYIGDKPWHGLGQIMTAGASLTEWEKAAGLDWRVEASRVVYRAKVAGQPEGRVMTIDDKRVLHRSDTGADLGIVSDKYKIVQPAEIIGFFDNLLRGIGLEISTMMSLGGGKRYLVCAKIGEQAVLDNRDLVRGYLSLITSADGSLATVAKHTSTRIVCANTLAMALSEKHKDGTVSISHRSKFDIAKIQDKLGVAPKTFTAFMDQMRHLGETRLSGDMAETMTEKLLGEAANDKSTPGILERFMGKGLGSDLDGVRGTVWGWLNAVTEYADHAMGTAATTDVNRFNNTMFGRGDELKNKARDMALDYAQA